MIWVLGTILFVIVVEFVSVVLFLYTLNRMEQELTGEFDEDEE